MSLRKVSRIIQPKAEQITKSQHEDEVIDGSRRKFCKIIGFGTMGLALGGEGCATTQTPKLKPDISESQTSDNEVSGIMSKLIRRIEARLTEKQKENALINCGLEDKKDANGNEVPDVVFKANAKAKAEEINNKIAGEVTKSVDTETEETGTMWIDCVRGERQSDKIDWEKEKNDWIALYSNVLGRIGYLYDAYQKSHKNQLLLKKVEASLFKRMKEIISTYKEIQINPKKVIADLGGKKISQRAKEISARIMQESIEEARISDKVPSNKENEKILSEISTGYFEMLKYLKSLRKKAK